MDIFLCLITFAYLLHMSEHRYPIQIPCFMLGYKKIHRG